MSSEPYAGYDLIFDSEGSLADIRTTALLRITSIIETAATLDELLMLGLAELASLFEMEWCGVLLLTEDGSHVQLVSSYPPRISYPSPILLQHAPQVQQVFHKRQAVQVTDCTAEAAQSAFFAALSHEGIRSVLLAPLVAHDRLTGVVVFATITRTHVFSEHEMTMARLLMGQLAAALSSFRIAEAARRRNSELATLNDIAAAVTSSLDTREIYHLVVQQLNEYFRVDAGSLLMRDDESGELEFVMTLEAGEEKLAGVRVPLGQGVVGHVAESQMYEIVQDATRDPRFYAKVSEDVGYQTRSILCVPLIVKGRTIGVIELLNKYDGDFTDEDAERLSRMAVTIGVALENARLFQQVMRGRDHVEAILNSTNDGILMADMRGIIVTVNPRVAAILDVSREALLGRHIKDVLVQVRTTAKDVSIPLWLRDDGASDVFEVEIEQPTGKRFLLRHLSLPVKDAHGEPIGQLSMFQDISNERELARLRDDYTGMLVHDLRAPLTAIMNGITMVRHGMGGEISEQQQQLLGISYNSSQTMLEMINTLLDISKMEQGRMVLHREHTSPVQLVDEPVARLQASAQGQHVHIHCDLRPDLPTICADHEKLVRVMQNLLDNAIKFSPAGGNVTAGAACVYGDGGGDPTDDTALPVTLPPLEHGNWVVLWVRDEGPGIPEEDRTRIFEKFGQVRRSKVRGTGLGLTFSKLAVEAHGGHIWLESMVGVGSTFAVALPVE